MKISGIYKITNNITGDFYIGSSKNIKARWITHKSPSTWKNKPGMKLYKAFSKYSLNNFTFEIIEETSNIHEREQYWIEQLNPTYNDRRANGWDFERYFKRHKEYHQTENCKEIFRKSSKRYYNQLCLYNGETLTLNALRKRFRRQGIPHPVLEAKKYLI
jgi:group I intron endonuclease